MPTIKVTASKEYDVILGKHASEILPKKIKELFGQAKVCFVTDDTVATLWLTKYEDILDSQDIENEAFIFPHGEKSKTPDTLLKLLDYLAEKHFTKSDVLVALGGGVAGDLAGLAAALFKRGMHIIMVPSTLLAMVDSSVGGKTAVNLEGGKNLMGVFNQPDLVLCDPMLLSTLPKEYFKDGMAEVIKYGVIADRELFDVVKNGYIEENLEAIIARCISIKRDIVAEDEFDRGKRQLLNFGHTLAHSIEKVSKFTISHGQAVAMGMVIISEIAYKNSLSEERCQDDIIDALLENKLPVSCPYNLAELYPGASEDKKCSGEKISLIVPVKIGSCRILKMSLDEFRELLNNGY